MQEDSKLVVLACISCSFGLIDPSGFQPREIQIHRRSARLASVDVMQTSLRVEECWDLNCFRGFAAVLCDGITRVIGGYDTIYFEKILISHIDRERNEMEFFWNDGGQV